MESRDEAAEGAAILTPFLDLALLLLFSKANLFSSPIISCYVVCVCMCVSAPALVTQRETKLVLTLDVEL